MVSRQIERAQRKVEEHNFDIRKHLLEYDEAPDEQRKTIYGLRQRVLEQDDLQDLVFEMIDDVLYDNVAAAVTVESAPETRSARPVAEWARGLDVAIRDDEWAGADRAAFRDLFVSRAVEAWRGRGREAVAAAAVENVLRLMCDEEAPFCLWDFSAVSRWARKRGLAVEADDLRQRFVEALREALCQAARKSLAHAAPEEVFDRLVTCGMDAFAPLSSVGSEDWNFRVLQEWGDALGLRIPVSQWQKTDMEDEAPEGKAGAEPPAEVDQDKAKRDEIRKWLAERLPRAAGSRPPVDLVCDMLRHELNRLLGVMEAEKASNYRTIVTALDSAFDLGVSDGELQAIVRTQRQRMAKDLAGLWLQATAQEPEEKLAPAAFEDMLAVFLDYDLARPGRNFAELSEMMRRRFEIEIDPFDLSHYALQDLPDRLMEQVREKYARRRAEMTPELEPARALPAASEDRQQVEGSSLQHGPPQRRHRDARLCAGGPEGRVHARSPAHVHGDDGLHPRRRGGPDPARAHRARGAGAQRRPDVAGRPDGAARQPGRGRAGRRRHARPAGSRHGQRAARRKAPPRAQDRPGRRPQRPLPLRQRQEIQEVLRRAGAVRGRTPWRPAEKGAAPAGTCCASPPAAGPQSAPATDAGFSTGG